MTSAPFFIEGKTKEIGQLDSGFTSLSLAPDTKVLHVTRKASIPSPDLTLSVAVRRFVHGAKLQIVLQLAGRATVLVPIWANC